MKRVDRLLAEWGIARDRAAGRRVFGERTEGRRGDNTSEEQKRIERGWCLGRKAIRQELL
jgi:hypothetical protein